MADSTGDHQDPTRCSDTQSHTNTKRIHTFSEQQLTNTAYLLGRLGREVRRRFTQILSGWNLNPSHYGILLLLEEIDQASQQQLAQRLTIDRANMVDLLDLLEKRGFVERTQDPGDRRRHAVKLTSSGREAIRQMRQAVDKLDQEEFFVGLDSQEQATLHALLIKLFKSLIEEGRDDQSGRVSREQASSSEKRKK
ncbi:MAG TPA: MarR family transcriptional regulator [Ktedonobacteraceae bacterium]